MPGKASYAELRVRIEELEEQNDLLRAREKMQLALLRAPLEAEDEVDVDEDEVDEGEVDEDEDEDE